MPPWSKKEQQSSRLLAVGTRSMRLGCDAPLIVDADAALRARAQRNSGSREDPFRPGIFVSCLLAWEAKIKAARKPRKRRNPNPSRNPDAGGKCLRRRRRSRADRRERRRRNGSVFEVPMPGPLKCEPKEKALSCRRGPFPQVKTRRPRRSFRRFPFALHFNFPSG